MDLGMFGSMRWIFTILMVICIVHADYIPSKRLSGMNSCISKQTCHECIQTPSCVWCMAPNFSENRCYLPNVNTALAKTCPEKYVYIAETSYSITKNDVLTKKDGGSISVSSSSSSSSSSFSSSSASSSGGASAGFNDKDIIQIKPQEINLKVRINEAMKIHFQYSQAEDYPVDLYYLMDLSKSMEDDKEKLSSLGQTLVEEMRKLTSNFRLGFGSFVDKVVMPYVNTMPRLLIAPCDKCAAPYGYKHVMKLSQDTSRFAELVQNASVSGNLDAPE